MSNNANSILRNKIAYFREKYRIQHDFSNLNKAIKMIEQASVLSGEEKSLIDSVWSLILVKSYQYTVEGFDFAEIIDMLCFLVTINYSCLCFRKIVPNKLEISKYNIVTLYISAH